MQTKAFIYVTSFIQGGGRALLDTFQSACESMRMDRVIGQTDAAIRRVGAKYREPLCTSGSFKMIHQICSPDFRFRPTLISLAEIFKVAAAKLQQRAPKVVGS